MSFNETLSLSRGLIQVDQDIRLEKDVDNVLGNARNVSRCPLLEYWTQQPASSSPLPPQWISTELEIAPFSPDLAAFPR